MTSCRHSTARHPLPSAGPPREGGPHLRHRIVIGGGREAADATDEATYLAVALKNAGSRMAVPDRWHLYADVGDCDRKSGHRSPTEFRRLTRDLYFPANKLGFLRRRHPRPDRSPVGSRETTDQRAPTDHRGSSLRRGGGWSASHYPVHHDPDRQWRGRIATVDRLRFLDQANPR